MVACSVCKTEDATRYLRCNHPGCPDGRESKASTVLKQMGAANYKYTKDQSYLAEATNYLVQSVNSQFRGMKIKWKGDEFPVELWFAVQDAYDRLNAEGAFEVGGKLFGMHGEEQAEYFICYDEKVCDQCICNHVDPEPEFLGYQTQVAKIIALLKAGTRVDF